MKVIVNYLFILNTFSDLFLIIAIDIKFYPYKSKLQTEQICRK